jgi:hypothetical protein
MALYLSLWGLVESKRQVKLTIDQPVKVSLGQDRWRLEDRRRKPLVEPKR